jgi:hypothetical protein
VTNVYCVYYSVLRGVILFLAILEACRSISLLLQCVAFLIVALQCVTNACFRIDLIFAIACCSIRCARKACFVHSSLREYVC